MSFQHPDALHELNRVMNAKCDEIALAAEQMQSRR